MPQKIVTITESGSGNVYNIGADAITYVVDKGSVREVTYFQQDRGPVVVDVTETLAAIGIAAGNQVAVTSTVSGQDISISEKGIILVEPNASASAIHYQDGDGVQLILADENVAAVIALASNLYSLTDSSNGIVAGYNVDLIGSVRASTAGGAIVQFPLDGMDVDDKEVDETVAAIKAGVNAL